MTSMIQMNQVTNQVMVQRPLLGQLTLHQLTHLRLPHQPQHRQIIRQHRQIIRQHRQITRQHRQITRQHRQSIRQHHQVHPNTQ